MASPAYPPAARSAGIEGTVVVSYVVGENGSVTEARVVRGPPELADACLQAVRGWRFSPAMSDGRPVAVKRSARFPFKLRT
jgi:protein TonB